MVVCEFAAASPLICVLQDALAVTDGYQQFASKRGLLSVWNKKQRGKKTHNNPQTKHSRSHGAERPAPSESKWHFPNKRLHFFLFVMRLRNGKRREKKKHFHKMRVLRFCLFARLFLCLCSLPQWMAALSSSRASAVQMRYGLAEVCRCLPVRVGASGFLNPVGN